MASITVAENNTCTRYKVEEIYNRRKQTSCGSALTLIFLCARKGKPMIKWTYRSEQANLTTENSC